MQTVAHLLAPILQILWGIGMLGAVLVFVLFAVENIRVLLERDPHGGAPGPPPNHHQA